MMILHFGWLIHLLWLFCYKSALKCQLALGPHHGNDYPPRPPSLEGWHKYIVASINYFLKIYIYICIFSGRNNSRQLKFSLFPMLGLGF
jgi:hypothetical protein